MGLCEMMTKLIEKNWEFLMKRTLSKKWAINQMRHMVKWEAIGNKIQQVGNYN